MTHGQLDASRCWSYLTRILKHLSHNSFNKQLQTSMKKKRENNRKIQQRDKSYKKEKNWNYRNRNMHNKSK